MTMTSERPDWALRALNPLGFGFLDTLMTRELGNDIDRGVINGCESLAQFCEDFILDLFDEADHHLIKYFDLFFGRVLCVYEKKIRDTLQDICTLGFCPIL